MTSRLEKERAKQIQDKCQNLLTEMLRDEDNKYCVDCDAKGSSDTAHKYSFRWVASFHIFLLAQSISRPNASYLCSAFVRVH